MHKLQRNAAIKSSRCRDSNNYALAAGHVLNDKKGTLTSADSDFISLSLVRAIMPLLYVRMRTSASSRVVLSERKHAEHDNYGYA